MSTPDSLYSLIQSFTGSEKRYFKLWSRLYARSGSKDSLLAQLFEDLAACSEYKEAEFLDRHAHRAYTRNFAARKHRLYDQLLSCLNAFHSQNSLKAKLRHRIQSIEILYQKGLYKQMRKLIARTRKLAETNDEFEFLIELNQWEIRVMGMLDRRGTGREELAGIMDAQLAEMERLYRSLHLRHYNFEVVMLAKEAGELRTAEQRSAFGRLQKALVRFDPGADGTLREYRDFLNATANLNLVLEQHDEALQYFLLLKSKMEARPRRIRKSPTDYLALLSNAFICAVEGGRSEVAYHFLAEMLEFPAQYGLENRKNIQVWIVEIGGIHTVNLFMMERNLELIREQLPVWEERVAEVGDEIRHISLLTFYYYFAVLNYLLGEHRQAAGWISLLLQNAEENVRKDLQSAARLVQLFLHFDLDNVGLLPYLESAAQRYAKSRDRLFRSEKRLLAFVRNVLADVPSAAEFRKQLQQLREELVELYKDPNEASLETYFDFLGWIDAKLEGRDFGEVWARPREADEQGSDKK